MRHEPRLDRDLRSLLNSQRVAALGTLDENGLPYVSMVPFALEPNCACLVIHVSSLAAHARHLRAKPDVSLLVMQSEIPGEPVHALPRVTLTAVARPLARGSEAWTQARTAYLTRFPDAEPLTHFDDFMFVAIDPAGARQVAGFGAARSLDADAVKAVLRPLS